MYWSCKFALKRHPLAVRQWWDLESRSTIICATLPTRSLGDHGWSLLTTPMPLLWISHHHRTLMKSLLGKGGNSKPVCCSVFEAVEFLERDVNQCKTCRMQPCNLLLHWHPSTQSLGLDHWDWMNHEPWHGRAWDPNPSARVHIAQRARSRGLRWCKAGKKWMNNIQESMKSAIAFLDYTLAYSRGNGKWRYMSNLLPLYWLTPTCSLALDRFGACVGKHTMISFTGIMIKMEWSAMIFHVLLTTELTPAPFHDEKNKVAQKHSHMDAWNPQYCGLRRPQWHVQLKLSCAWEYIVFITHYETFYHVLISFH